MERREKEVIIRLTAAQEAMLWGIWKQSRVIIAHFELSIANYSSPFDGEALAIRVPIIMNALIVSKGIYWLVGCFLRFDEHLLETVMID